MPERTLFEISFRHLKPIFCIYFSTFIPRSRSLRISEVGSPWVSFFFIYLIFAFTLKGQKFYPPLLELLKCSPMGSHLILFLFYITPNTLFLISKSPYSAGLFWSAEFFILTDGWDGRSTFFFLSYLGNYSILFLNSFSSLKYMFLHFFWNILKKKMEWFFFQKISPKSRFRFFRIFFF